MIPQRAEQVTVVKIGGNVIDDGQALDRFLDDFARLPDPKVLVHGGGRLATRMGERLGIPVRMIDGRRVTDAATLEVVVMVYAGWVNKRIVAGLQARGCNALGLTGADGGSIPAVRRAPEPVDYGFVGDILPGGIDTRLLASLLGQGIAPVFCAITCDTGGTLLNTNADSVASALAQALASTAGVRLVFCFEKPGVLADLDDPSSLIRTITPATFAALRERGAITGGMIPKVEGALRAVERGVERVEIKDARHLLCDVGTTIKSR